MSSNEDPRPLVCSSRKETLLGGLLGNPGGGLSIFPSAESADSEGLTFLLVLIVLDEVSSLVLLWCEDGAFAAVFLADVLAVGSAGSEDVVAAVAAVVADVDGVEVFVFGAGVGAAAVMVVPCSGAVAVAVGTSETGGDGGGVGTISLGTPPLLISSFSKSSQL